MKIDSNDLSLFGLDLSKTFGYVRLAWHDLLWGKDSPLRKAFAETTKVKSANNEQAGYYCLGIKKNLAAPKVLSNAYILPDEIILQKNLKLPASLELELAEVVQLEILASCPFEPEETRFAWLSKSDGGDFIDVQVAMARKADIERHKIEAGLDENEIELWAMLGSGVACFEGGALEHRNSRYKKRLLTTFSLLLISYLLLLFSPAIISTARALQAEKVEQQFASLKQSSAKAVALKEELAKKNIVLEEVDSLLTENSNILQVLAGLTNISEDSVWFRSVRFDKDKLQLQGYADNAGEFLQLLSQHKAFEQVKQRGGIRKDRASGQEVFTVEMQLVNDHLLELVDLDDAKNDKAGI